MPDAGGDDDDIAAFHRNFNTPLSTEHGGGAAGVYPQRFMCGTVIVMIIVDAVPPCGRPTVDGEKIFEELGRPLLWQIHRVAV